MSIRLLSGDCRDILPTLPADSVHTVVTSPPYYGLRDYGTAEWSGGDDNCQHEMRRGKAFSSGTWRNGADYSGLQKVLSRDCACGAVRIDRQLGLEATPEAYIAAMVGVFREVRRVLRGDGTCWVNIGDSYNANQGTGFDTNRNGGGRKTVTMSPKVSGGGLAAKQLLLMPARLALALQADGWWVRSAITWCKANPMPESAKDRCTSATEMIYMLTKRPTYFYDAIAIAERSVSDHPSGNGYKREPRLSYGGRGNDEQWNGIGGTRNARNWWLINTEAFPSAHFATFPTELVERCVRAGTSERGCCAACGAPWVREVQRNLDNVPLRVATKRAPVDCEALGAYLRNRREALGLLQKDVALHFPSVTGGLTGCVANWELGLNTPMPEQWVKLREVLALDDRFDEQICGTVEVMITDHSPDKASGVRTYAKAWNVKTETTGWRAGCGCNAETVPATVLDPFSGSGTTLLVADRLQRNAIGIDLSATYADMARNRIEADCPLFTSFPPAEDPEDTRMADLFSYAAD